MAGFLLTEANRAVRLWAVAQIVQANAPYPNVQILHSPDDTKTLLLIPDHAIPAGRTYYNCVPVAHTKTVSAAEFNALCDHIVDNANAQQSDVKSARDQLTAALVNGHDAFAVVNLAAEQATQFELYANALRRINHAKQKENAGLNSAPQFSAEIVSGVLAVCIADLHRKSMLPWLAFPTREGHKYSLSIVDCSADQSSAATWLQKKGVAFCAVPDTSYYGPLIVAAEPGFPAFMFFDRTAGMADRGVALNIKQEDLPKLASAIGKAHQPMFRDSAELSVLKAHKAVVALREKANTQRTTIARRVTAKHRVV